MSVVTLQRRKPAARNFQEPSDFFFYQTRQAVHSLDVEKIVSSLSRKKAIGLDKILIHVINIAAPVIIPSITAIINSSFTTSTYPGD